MTFQIPSENIPLPIHLIAIFKQMHAYAAAYELKHSTGPELGYLLDLERHTMTMTYRRPPVADNDRTVLAKVRALSNQNFEQLCTAVEAGEQPYSIPPSPARSQRKEIVVEVLYEREPNLAWRFDDVAAIGETYITIAKEFPSDPCIDDEWLVTVPVYYEYDRRGINVLTLRKYYSLAHEDMLDSTRRPIAIQAVMGAIVAAMNWLAPDRPLPGDSYQFDNQTV